MKSFSLHIIFCAVTTALLCGCHGLGGSDSSDGPLVIGGDTIKTLRLCQTIDSLLELDNDTLAADRAMRRFYRNKITGVLDGKETNTTDNNGIILCWLTNDGVTSQADTLLNYVTKAEECGLKPELFLADEIKDDIRRVDTLDFSGTDVYTVIARMDITLTKSFLRWAGNQRYGFTNPYKLFNQLDQNKSDTTRVVFRQLYDTPTELIGRKGYQHIASLSGTDSVSLVLQEAEPRSALYKALKARLQTASGTERQRLLVNMERCRWRHPHYPSEYDKYVLVNIPSYELFGYDDGDTVAMRIVCGSKDTKTPLVQSNIMRMDINPRWMLPFSIVKHDIARHAGNIAYFEHHRYHIVDKTTGDEYQPERVTKEMFLSGGIRVYQEGGEGNSLGRIIFRFLNNFSIFLHDTSTKGTFSQLDRSASHGCVRVQKPFELAEFLLKDKDPELLDKIHFSMTAKDIKRPKKKDGEEESGVESDYDPTRLVHSVKVEPQVPLFITYYTMYLMPDGQLHTYPDVYRYDPVIYEKLDPFFGQ